MNKPNILITGSTGNLGRATVQAFVDAGYNVIGTIEPHHTAGDQENVSYVKVNLKSEEETKNMLNQLKSEYEKIDGLICIAGGFAMSNISNSSMQDFQSQIDLNFYTAFNIVKPCYEWMKSTGGGSIILISAKPALDGGAFEVLPYAISKGMIRHFAEVLNENSKVDNIVTSVIAPGIIDTKVNREAMPDQDFSAWVKPEEIADNMVHMVSPSGRVQQRPVLRLYNKV